LVKEVLTVAMVGEQRQNKRRKKAMVTGMSTPKKRRRPENAVIGSSSTWNEDQLELFKVEVRGGIKPREIMILDKWFDFSGLERYQAGPVLFGFWLMVVRMSLVSVRAVDLANDDVLFKKSAWFYWSFKTLHRIQRSRMTDTRKKILTEKHHQKHSQQYDDDSVTLLPFVSETRGRRVGPPPLPQSQEEYRIASISDPEKSSTGSRLHYSCREQATQDLGNLFCAQAITSVFSTDPSLLWVTGRPELSVLEWSSEYPLLFSLEG